MAFFSMCLIARTGPRVSLSGTVRPFLDIGFPDQECKKYIGEFINLYGRYPELLSIGADREDIEQPKPELRRVDEAQGQ